MTRSRLVWRDNVHEPYELFVAVGFGIDVFLLLVLGFALGRCSTLLF